MFDTNAVVATLTLSELSQESQELPASLSPPGEVNDPEIFEAQIREARDFREDLEQSLDEALSSAPASQAVDENLRASMSTLQTLSAAAQRWTFGAGHLLGTLLFGVTEALTTGLGRTPNLDQLEITAPKLASVLKRLRGAGSSPRKTKAKSSLPASESPEAKKTEDRPSIVSIEIIDSDKADKFTSGTAAQFVNVPKKSKWVDGKRIKQKDRCSQKLRFKVKFDRPGGHGFKVRMKAGGSNAAYTAKEEGRNGNFKYQKATKSYSCKGDGTRIVDGDFFVTPAGNDQFWLEAIDDQMKSVKSPAVKTKRLIYCVEVKMKGLSSVATSTATAAAEFDKQGIIVEMLPAVEMTHMPNISTKDSDTFKKHARKAYKKSDGPSKEPIAVALGYTDHLAVMDAKQVVVKSGVTVGPRARNVKIPILSGMKKKYLWQGLVPGEGWFVSATFLKQGGRAGRDEVKIDQKKCKAVARSRARPKMSSKVEVDVTGLPAGKGTITLTVNWVNRMRAGLSFRGGNLICVCTRAWWRDISTADQNEVIVHEMGHKIGMVPDGSGKGPDKTATQYSGKGHKGSHCHKGQPVKASYKGLQGTCVMFGATSGVSAFCGNCAPAAKKVDLSGGWSRF